MPVALNNPLPASPATPAGGSVATASAAGAEAAPRKFFTLLTGMSGPTALLDPGADVAADLSGIAELLDLAGQDADGDSDRDGEAGSEEESLLAALGLPLLPATPPPRPPGTLGAGSTGSAGPALAESVLAALGNADGGTGADEARDAMLDTLASTELLEGSESSSGTTGSSTTSQTSSSPVPTALHALAAAAHTAHGGTDAGAPRDIKAPVGSHAWSQQLGDEITWMAQQGREAASLRLTPDNMGPLEVRIAMRDGEASVWFGAHHADTRSALEQALPRLREMFASQGLALADAGVFKEAPSQQPRQQSFASNALGLEGPTESSVTRAVPMSARLLDAYA